MAVYLNEGFLARFVYTYYPFQSIDQVLIEKGLAVLQGLVEQVINQTTKLSNLKKYKTHDIVHILSTEFSYKFGGNQYFFSAFANFHERRMQQKHQHITIRNQIEQVIDLLKIILTSIAEFERQHKKFPIVTAEDIVNKKINYLKQFVNLQNQKQTYHKKTRIKKKAQRNTNTQKIKTIVFDQGWKIEEQPNTEVDDQSSRFSENQLFLTGKSTLNQIHLEQFEQKLRRGANQSKQSNKRKQFILKFDDIFPEDQNQTHLSQDRKTKSS